MRLAKGFRLLRTAGGDVGIGSPAGRSGPVGKILASQRQVVPGEFRQTVIGKPVGDRTAEEMKARGHSSVDPHGAEEVGVHVHPGIRPVAAALDGPQTAVEHVLSADETRTEGRAQFPRSQWERLAAVAEFLEPEIRFQNDAGIAVKRIRDEINGPADRRGTVKRAPRPALHLHVPHTRKEVGEIQPVHVVVFRIVLRNPVDHDRDPSLVESTKRHIVIPDPVPVFGICGDGWKLREEDGNILHRVAGVNLCGGQIGKCHWSLPLPSLSCRNDNRRHLVDCVTGRIGLLRA